MACHSDQYNQLLLLGKILHFIKQKFSIKDHLESLVKVGQNLTCSIQLINLKEVQNIK